MDIPLSTAGQRTREPRSQSSATSAQATWAWLSIGGLLLLAAGVAAVALFAPATEAVDSAAMLAAITASAVGIERVIEIFWTVIGQTVGSFWPLMRVHTQMKEFVDTLNTRLAPVYNQVDEAVNNLSKADANTQAKIEAGKQQIEGLKKSLGAFQNLAPGGQRSRLIIAVTNQALGEIEKNVPTVAQAAQVAKQATDIAKNVLETFKDNPARRLISIYAGAILGLVVAATTGLNVFQATGVSLTLPGLGVALTGLLIGLGASPTHEAIRVLQEIKEGRKAENNRQIDA